MVDSDARVALLDDGGLQDQDAVIAVLDVNAACDDDVLGFDRESAVVGCGGKDITSWSRNGREEREGSVTLALGNPGGTVRESQARRGHIVGSHHRGKHRDGQAGENLG